MEIGQSRKMRNFFMDEGNFAFNSDDDDDEDVDEDGGGVGCRGM